MDLLPLFVLDFSPVILLVGLYLFCLGEPKLRKIAISSEYIWGFYISVLVTTACTIYMIRSVLSFIDAQGALLLIVIPFYGFIVVVISFGIGWSTGVLLNIRKDFVKGHSVFRLVKITLSVLILVAGIAVVSKIYFKLAPYYEAESFSTSGERLRAIYASRGDYAPMARRLAQNLNTPPDVLRELARDRDALVSQSVARNPNTPIAVLKDFSSDKEKYKRCSVALNPSTPKELSEMLLNDEDEFVRRCANERSAEKVYPPFSIRDKETIFDLLFR